MDGDQLLPGIPPALAEMLPPYAGRLSDGVAYLYGEAVFASAERMFGFPRGSIAGPRRQRAVVYVRHLAWFYLRYGRRRITLMQIGRVGRRDHSTVIHGIRVIKGMWELFPEVSEDVQKLRRRAKWTIRKT